MAKLFFHNRDELVTIDTSLVAAVKACGNYSQVVYITKRMTMITEGIGNLETLLKKHNTEEDRFVRIGRSIIINHRYLYRIDLIKQQVVLWDGGDCEIRITIAKNVLKAYKNAVVKSEEIKAERSHTLNK